MKTNEDKLRLGTKVAPAVGLLLFGERALAQCDTDVDDAEPCVEVPEPSTLTLLAMGMAAVGVVHAIKKWREK